MSDVIGKGGGFHHHGGYGGHGGVTAWWPWWDARYDYGDFECDENRCEEIFGAYDIADWARQMSALKQVPVSVAKILLRNGQWAIDHAKLVAKQKNLPGDTARDSVYWKLQWHQNALASANTAPSVMYASGDDLKKWAMQAFIEANAADEGAAYLDQAWQAMWVELKAAIAALPAQARAAVYDAASGLVQGVTGVPLWAWVAGGAVLVGLTGYAVYKIGTGPLGQAAVSTAVRRYLP